MLNKNIDQITEKDLQELISNSVSERKTLEYKKILPGNSDKDKKEFLADVSSFANASGGDIIYGISCDGETGLPQNPLDGLSIDNFDAEILRLENSIRDGIQPRIIGIISKSIQLTNSRNVLLVRIPKSWNSPHRVIFQGNDKFYSRSTNGKYPFDVDELRSAFTSNTTLLEKIIQFRKNRVFSIDSDDTPIKLDVGSKLILHIIPFTSLPKTSSVDIGIVADNMSKLPPMGTSGWDGRYNLDGFISFRSRSKGSCYSYTQLYRNGIIESACTINEPTKINNPSLAVTYIERILIQSLESYFKLTKELGVELPVYVFVTLLGVKNYIITSQNLPSFDIMPIDRENLLLNGELLESYDNEAYKILRPIFDSIWNACGYSHSYNYNSNGIWSGTHY